MNIIFKQIKRKVKNIIKYRQKKFVIRKRKLSAHDMFYLFLYYSVSGVSFSYLSLFAKNKLNIDISKCALIKKFNNINKNDMQQLNLKLTEKLFDFKNNINYIAVDGSYLNVDNKFKFNYPSSKDKKYKKILLSGLYDIKKEIPLCYSLNKTNERTALLNDIKYIPSNKNIIIIADRGYFSYHVINELLKNNINFILRIKSNLNIVKNNIQRLKKNKVIIIKHDNRKYKLFYYLIDKNEYYILTSKIDHNLKMIKELYKSRWSIEEHFKVLKNEYNFNNIKGWNNNYLINKLYMTQFNILLNQSFNKELIYDKNKYKINKRTSKELLKDNILDYLFLNTVTLQIKHTFSALQSIPKENKVFF